MDRRTLRIAVAAALASSAGGLSQLATAQQAGASAGGGGLEEILVTATRREQNLQEVPISIVAITGEGLEMRGLDSLEDVGQSVPNIVITGGGASTGNTSFRVRGIPNVGGGALVARLVAVPDRHEPRHGVPPPVVCVPR
jgi:outer membrane receptor protein involved in Fe transport